MTATATPTPTLFRFARRTDRLKPSAIREILKATEAPDVISFAGGLPARELFPVKDFARACEQVLADEDAPGAMQYGVTEGYLPLRKWVCEHLAETVGLRCTPEQVLITNGSQQALDLVAKVLIDPGDVVLVEDPAYLGALHALAAYQARVVGVSADDQGVRIDALRAALEAHRGKAKLLYLIPSFQNPTGVSASPQRRAAVAALAGEFGVPLLEDDPYGRLYYGGPPPPAISSRMDGGWVFLGTSSKIMAPGMRVAWLATPDRPLYEKLIPAKQAADLHTSTFTQRVVWRYASAPGLLGAHLDKLRSAYGRRRDTMLAALRKHLPDGCTWTEPEGGLFVWVRVPPRIDTTELLKAATAKKVAFVPGEPFWVEGSVRNTLRLNFSNATEERIEEGMRRLGEVVKAAV